MRCASGGTPPGTLVGGKIMDVGGVASALHQLLSRAEIDQAQALIAIGDSIASFRMLNAPASATDQDIDAIATREFPVDPDRMSSVWTEVSRNAEHRAVYVAVWDRTYVQRATEVAKAAGLQTVAVELKSSCIARAVSEPSCVVVDMSSDPIEIFLIDDHVPQLWHSIQLTVPVDEDGGAALVGPLRQVVRFYERRRAFGFGSGSPILIVGEQLMPGQVMANLSTRLGHPVKPMIPPPRVRPEVRHDAYLACLGLIMRRGYGR
jgi:hypothetical protein